MTGIVTFMYLQNITPNFYFDRYFNENIFFYLKTEYNGSLFVFIFFSFSNLFGWISLSVCTFVVFHEWMALYPQIKINKKKNKTTISILFVEMCTFYKFIRILLCEWMNEIVSKWNLPTKISIEKYLQVITSSGNIFCQLM